MAVGCRVVVDVGHYLAADRDQSQRFCMIMICLGGAEVHVHPALEIAARLPMTRIDNNLCIIRKRDRTRQKQLPLRHEEMGLSMCWKGLTRSVEIGTLIR